MIEVEPGHFSFVRRSLTSVIFPPSFLLFYNIWRFNASSHAVLQLFFKKNL